MSSMNGKVVLISGGARGMGEAQARLIVQAGGKVLLGDILHEQGRALAAELGAACVYQPLDVTVESQWQAAVAEALKLGPLFGLVNNAGVYLPSPMLDTDTELFERHMRVNQLGTFLGMKSVAKAMGENGEGSIINLSSTVSLRSAPNAIAYTASKWAVRGMSKSAALELADLNIRVNSVHPGPIDTDMLKIRSREDMMKRVQQLPFKRMGTVDDIAGLVMFLLSDASRYMTGAELAIDGGAAM